MLIGRPDGNRARMVDNGCYRKCVHLPVTHICMTAYNIHLPMHRETRDQTTHMSLCDCCHANMYMLVCISWFRCCVGSSIVSGG